MEVQAVPPNRITLTFPILNRASRIYFLVSGADKAEALAELTREANLAKDFQSDSDMALVENLRKFISIYPAAGIVPSNGKLTWWIDRAASDDRIGRGRVER